MFANGAAVEAVPMEFRSHASYLRAESLLLHGLCKPFTFIFHDKFQSFDFSADFATIISSNPRSLDRTDEIERKQKCLRKFVFWLLPSLILLFLEMSRIRRFYSRFCGIPLCLSTQNPVLSPRPICFLIIQQKEYNELLRVYVW